MGYLSAGSIVQITASSNIRQFQTRLLNDVKQLRYASAVMLTKTAKDVQKAIVDRMGVDFDRPTKYTLGSMTIKPAKKDDLEAIVKPRDVVGRGTPAEKYLTPQIFGTSRNRISSERKLDAAQYMLPGEFAVPAKAAELDGNGNFKKGMWNRIPSEIKAAGEAKQTTRTRKKNKGVAKKSYFVIDQHGSALKPGIYRRVGKRIEPVLIFVSSPRYAKRLRYFETADATFAARLLSNWNTAYDMAMK